MEVGEKLVICLASTLNLDGTPSSATFDAVGAAPACVPLQLRLRLVAQLPAPACAAISFPNCSPADQARCAEQLNRQGLQT